MKLLSLSALRAEADAQTAEHDHGCGCRSCLIARTVLALFVARETPPGSEAKPVFERKDANDVWVRVLETGEIQWSNKHQIVNGGPVWTTYTDSAIANILARELLLRQREFAFAEHFDRFCAAITPSSRTASLRTFNFDLTGDDLDSSY